MSYGGDAGGDKGRTVGGRYRLLDRIGSGGTGTVWRAHDELVDREVAVKEPRLPGDPEDEEHRRAAHRRYREARAAARVEHPSAVSIHDVVVEEETAGPDGPPWIVMELVRGESLDEVLRRGPLDPVEAARVGHAVLGALRAAHAVGIVHRDVKPANVLLGPHGRVVLTDFGIPHVQGEEALTAAGESVGPLEFIAPERMSGRGAGPASDLWSLGVLLYAAVEGWSPFRRTTPESTLAAILAADPPEPKQAGPLGPLLVRLLARDPDRRPGAAEVAAALEAVAEGRPAPTATGADDEPPAPTPGGTPTPAPRTTGPGEAPASAPGGAPASASRVTAPGEAPITAPEGAPAPAPRTTHPGEAPATTPEEPPTTTPEEPPAPAPHPVAVPPSRPAATRRSLHRRPLAMALLAALLSGSGAWFATSAFGGDDRQARGLTATYEQAPLAGGPSASPTPTPTPASWVAHSEPDLDAVLSLPAPYRESARQGGASEQPRQVVYSAGSVDVRLTLWDRAPASPTGRAAQAHRSWDGYDGDARTRTTRTTFHGHEAVLADTTYGRNGTPTRVMELFVRTDDSRLYELRVDMPKGTPDEKQGTAVFEAARDRLRIGTP